jgi:hypothetical protein
MTTQLLIYETAVPVSSGRHGKCSVEGGKGYAFTRSVNSVPLMAVEIPQAATEYAIVFTQSKDEVMPVVILGARQGENLYLGADDSWTAKYIPAFIRRYPFVFSATEDGKSFTLCVDEAFQGLNYQGRGQALFTADGAQTPYVGNVLKFLQDYRAQFLRTKAFCRKLAEHKLLEPMQAQFTLGQEEKISLGGFLAVDRERLKKLPGDVLAQLAATDELELLYLHLQSMRNFSFVKDRLASQRNQPEGDAAPTQPASQAAGDAQPATPIPPEDKAANKAKRGAKGDFGVAAN